jgi:hypothetical protein
MYRNRPTVFTSINVPTCTGASYYHKPIPLEGANYFSYRCVAKQVDHSSPKTSYADGNDFSVSTVLPVWGNLKRLNAVW